MENLLQWQEFRKNIFFIQNNSREGIIYSPLQGKFFSADDDAIDVVNDYIELGNPSDHVFHEVLKDAEFFNPITEPKVLIGKPYQPSEVMISLSNSCNLRCTYCYAETGNKIQVLPWESIVQTISQLYKYAIEFKRETVEITFHGTGETFVKWETLVKTVSYAVATKPESVDLDFSIVTNGTLINRERAKFLSEHNFFITLSLDGLSNTQNKQRPNANGKGSFDDAINGLKILLDAGIRVAIRSTITGDNQGEMPEFVRYCIGLGCKNIALMPFSAVGRGADGITPLDKDIFIEKFLDAQKIAGEFGVNLRMPGAEIEKSRISICGAGGKNCEVTPTGDISCCSRVTKKEDPLSNVFFIGKVSEQGFIIDQDKVNELNNLNLYSYQDCADCFVKYQCSGGCHHDRLSFGGMPVIWCEIARELVWHELRDLAVNQQS